MGSRYPPRQVAAGWGRRWGEIGLPASLKERSARLGDPEQGMLISRGDAGSEVRAAAWCNRRPTCGAALRSLVQRSSLDGHD